ncbi:MAG: hypothetical protein ACXIUV_02155 [Alkalilacustris sp.]
MSVRGALAALAAGLLALLLAGAPLPGAAAEGQAAEERAAPQASPATGARAVEGGPCAPPDLPDAAAPTRSAGSAPPRRAARVRPSGRLGHAPAMGACVPPARGPPVAAS